MTERIDFDAKTGCIANRVRDGYINGMTNFSTLRECTGVIELVMGEGIRSNFAENDEVRQHVRCVGHFGTVKPGLDFTSEDEHKESSFSDNSCGPVGDTGAVIRQIKDDDGTVICEYTD